MGKDTLKNKTVAILAANEFEDIEIFYPLLRLSEEGARIILATLPTPGWSPRPFVPGKPITGRFGLTVPPTWLREGNRYSVKPIAELQPGEIDAIVVPGGFSPDNLRRDPTTVALVRDAVAAGKIVAAICHGPWLLYSAEVVKGKRITGFPSVRDDGIHAGAEWVSAPVVRDGGIITSRDPDDLPEFCLEIIEALKEQR